ncbi:MAG: serine/threonine-protein kinase [Candidatus Eiseniibacteriota bacterium]
MSQTDETIPSGPTPGPSHPHGLFLPGTVLENRYRIVALAGRGGMGEVYRADDLRIGQPVALKFLPPFLERDADRLQRLLGEVRIARQVSHPNVCRVYDASDFEGRHFITMEYVDGEDLAALLRRIGRLPQEKAIDLARQIASGLAAAHIQGIVHRDLKPANIMLDGRGRARITDFGIATAAEFVGAETEWGTPAYMAPEQLEGKPASPRTDIYALGIVVYEMLTGRRPFDGSVPRDRGSGADTGAAPPSSLVPGLDPAIDAAVLRSLDADPARRPASAMEWLSLLPGGDALEAAMRAGETPSPEMVAAAPEEGRLSSGRAWGLLAVTLLAAAAAIAFGARVIGLDRVPMTRNPEVLRERAREIARELGNDVPARAEEWWWALDPGFVVFSRGSPGRLTLPDARPAALRFHYRQSPRPIQASRWDQPPTERDPAPFWHGDTYVALDTEGRLLEFSRIGSQLDSMPQDVASMETDWTRLLALAGANRARLEPVVPRWTPEVAADARGAWLLPESTTTLRLEAASWRGKPVWFRTIAPWEQAEREASESSEGRLGSVVFVVTVFLLVPALVLLSLYNFRVGRSDTRGALRLALTVFLLFAIGSALAVRWTDEPRRVFQWLYEQPYLPALIAGLYFLGVEPFVRRRWPHRLIAWTRMLSGRFADPLVGREVLVGILMGALVALLQDLPAVVEGRPDVDLLLRALPLGRDADFWGWVTSSLGDAVMKGIGSFSILVVLRVLIRRDAAAWAGLGVFWFLANAPPGNASTLQWLVPAVAALCVVLTARVGILAITIAMATLNLLIVTPLTLDPSRWYAWRTGVILVLLLTLALWGFVAVMGRRRIMNSEILEG